MCQNIPYIFIATHGVGTSIVQTGGDSHVRISY